MKSTDPGRHAPSQANARVQSRVRAGGLLLDTQSHEVWRETSNVERVRLRPTEFRILLTLAEHFNRVVATKRLVEVAWDYGYGDGSMLKTHISHLRGKLQLRPTDAGRTAELVARSRVGYLLRAITAHPSERPAD